MTACRTPIHVVYMIVKLEKYSSEVKFKWYGTILQRPTYTLTTVGIHVYEHPNGRLYVVVPFAAEAPGTRHALAARHGERGHTPHMSHSGNRTVGPLIIFKVFPPLNCNNGKHLIWEIPAPNRANPCPRKEPALFHMFNPDFHRRIFEIELMSNFLADIGNHQMHDEHYEYNLKTYTGQFRME